MTFTGKVVLITGAAQGIGLEYSRKFGAAGATVIMTDIQQEQLTEESGTLLAEGYDIHSGVLNIADAPGFAAFVDGIVAEHGHIDVLVNNAAIYAGYTDYTLMELPLADWNRFIDVNLSGILNGIQAVAPHMKKAKSGRIINQSSAGAAAPRSHYSVTKLGVQAITLSLARSLGGYGITVNTIAPGVTGTAATRAKYTDAQLDAMISTRTLLKKMADATNIADAVLWLASDDASFTTGQILRVDAGYVLNPA